MGDAARGRVRWRPRTDPGDGLRAGASPRVAATRMGVWERGGGAIAGRSLGGRERRRLALKWEVKLSALRVARQSRSGLGLLSSARRGSVPRHRASSRSVAGSVKVRRRRGQFPSNHLRTCIMWPTSLFGFGFFWRATPTVFFSGSHVFGDFFKIALRMSMGKSQIH